MEGLKELLVKDITISNKTLRQADSLLRGMLSKSAEEATSDLSTLFCDSDSSLFPNNFLGHALTAVREKGFEDKFSALCKEKCQKSFWSAEKANVCSFLNFWTLYGNEMTFSGKEFDFTQIVCKNIESFPPHSLKVLPKAIDAFYAFATEKMYQFDYNLLQLDNDFDFKHPLSYFATAFLKAVNHEMCYESTGVVRFIVKTLSILYTREILEEVFKGNDLSKHLCSKMTPQRYTFLLAELARELKSSVNAVAVFDRAKEMTINSTDPDVLTHCYNSVSLVVLVIDDLMSRLEDSAEFMLRDFSTANDSVRLALCRLFEAIIKRAEQENTIIDVSHYFVDRFIEIPWNSRLKKFVMPTLLRFVHPERSTDLLETLLAASEDQNNKPFIAKCVSSFAGLKDICLSFINVMISDAQKTEETSQLIPLHVLLSPLFKANKDLIEEMYKKVELVTDHFARSWLRFDLVISAPSISKNPDFIDSLREDFVYGRHSGNWNLRSRSIAAFSVAGFPHTDADCDAFVADYDSLLLTDSTIQHTEIADSMLDLFKRISTQTKRFSTVNTEKFLSQILSITASHMLSCYIPTQRQFAYVIASGLWRYFPQIGGIKEFTCLASLLTDRAFDIRQQVISTMRELSKQPKIAAMFTSLKSSDVDQFVLRVEKKKALHIVDSDFPEIETEAIKKMNLLLARNDTSVEPSEFYTKKLIPQLLDEEKLAAYRWELQAEIFSFVSLLITKLRHEIDINSIEDATKFVFNVLFTTRKPGLVCGSVETFERLLKVLYFLNRNSVANEFATQLISHLSAYDMSSMRRSAGLPFMTLALIRSEPSSSPLNLFNRLTSALVDLVHTTDSSVEATNAMNIMKAIVNESEVTAKCEPMYGTILGCIFDACYRFTSWDVISAIDLTIVAFLRKTCNIGGIDAAARTSIIRVQFFSKIVGAREIILNALRSSCVHANYLAMAILELFKADTGDSEIATAVAVHLSSRFSRMRRVAARSMIAVLAISERKERFQKLASQISKTGWNAFHGIVLCLHEIAKVTDVKGLNIPSIPLNSIPPMAREDYIASLIAAGQDPGELNLKQGTFISDEASALALLGIFNPCMTPRTIVPLLRKWGSRPASKEMLDSLLSLIINDHVLEMNEAFSINATQFLVSKLPPASISPDKLEHILVLAKKAHSIALCAALLSLVRFVSKPDSSILEKYKDYFLECALDFTSRMAPVHIALSSIANILLLNQSLLPVVFLLVINDVPFVRTNVLSSFSEKTGINIQSESVVVSSLLSRISKEEKHSLGVKWITRLENLIQLDLWGEPLSLFVDELYVPRVCIPELSQVIDSLDIMLPIIEMRKKFVELAKMVI